MWGRTSLVAALAGVVVACGSSSSAPAPPQGPGFFITISGLAFSPLNLKVPPGATVTVINQDSMAHDVTSEATENAFVRGTVSGISFETGPFTGVRAFTLPQAAPTGTVVPYFCNIHKSTMATPNATITIDPTAVATTPPAGGGGGGGGGY